MTAFECDEPADFMHLMLTLRESEASRYTERDTPIFVGRHLGIREALDAARRGVGQDARLTAARLGVRVLVAPRAEHREPAEAEHEQERCRVGPRRADVPVGARCRRRSATAAP